MKLSSILALTLAVTLATGCATLENTAPPATAGAGAYRTFDAPIARVKPAFVSTLASMGMAISAVEVRGKREVLKARKAGSSVEIELERLGPASTRARVAMNTGAAYDAAATARFIQQTEKLLVGV